MAADRSMTHEELMDNYTFKLAKKMLMREYPFVLDVRFPSHEDVNKYNLIFLDIVIDPRKLQEEYGWEIIWYMKNVIGRYDEGYTSPYLSTLFEQSEGPRALQQQMEDELVSICKTTAIPKELKLPEGRKFNIGSFTIPKDTI